MKSKAQVPTILQGLKLWMNQQILGCVSIGGGRDSEHPPNNRVPPPIWSCLGSVGQEKHGWRQPKSQAWPEFLSLCRTPCPVTTPHPCAAQWITNPPHPRRRRWQKWLRRAMSPRSVSLKVRDRAGLETLWTGGDGYGEGKMGVEGPLPSSSCSKGTSRLPELSPNSKSSCTTTEMISMERPSCTPPKPSRILVHLPPGRV